MSLHLFFYNGSSGSSGTFYLKSVPIDVVNVDQDSIQNKKLGELIGLETENFEFMYHGAGKYF